MLDNLASITVMDFWCFAAVTTKKNPFLFSIINLHWHAYAHRQHKHVFTIIHAIYFSPII